MNPVAATGAAGRRPYTLKPMSRKLVECVPNFSEGRDRVKVESIAAAIQSSPRRDLVLDLECDADHNRSVITFVAPPESVVEAALAGAAKAVELIDLTIHTGVHPRIGAVDVMPFVPLEGVTLEECVKLAEQAAARCGSGSRCPRICTKPRRGGPSGPISRTSGAASSRVCAKRSGPIRTVRPISATPSCIATAGATVVGARKFLIAYNINLGTADVEIAKRIAKGIRHLQRRLPVCEGDGCAAGLAQSGAGFDEPDGLRADADPSRVRDGGERGGAVRRAGGGQRNRRPDPEAGAGDDGRLPSAV